MDDSLRLSVVLPCYNESRGLEAIVSAFHRAGRDVPFELILVDNGSTDDTAIVLESLRSRYTFIRCVSVARNRGYGDGVLSGLRAATAPVLAWTHADLQTDPADVFRAFALYSERASNGRLVVKGRRSGRELQERLISWGMAACATLFLRTPLSEINAQPKLFGRELLDLLVSPPLDFNFDLYVLYCAKSAGWDLVDIPVEFPPRQYGESNWAATWWSKLRTIARSFRYMVRLGWGI